MKNKNIIPVCKRIAIFISGRGSNMQALLVACESGVLNSIAKPVLVFSNKSDALGLEIAKSQGIETATISSRGKKRVDFDHEVVKLLGGYNVDYIILAGYTRILSTVLIRKFSRRIINIHPADPSKFKGLGAYNWAYENSLPQTEVTVHYVDEGVDTGEIIDQAIVDLRGADTLAEVERRGLVVEHEFYPKALVKVFC